MGLGYRIGVVLVTVAELTEESYHRFPAGHVTWTFSVDDPPPPGVPPAGSVVTLRGAMVPQNLRVTVGDDVFFTILRNWADTMRDGNAEDFVAYAERMAGRSLDAVFDTWLYSTGKPATGPDELVPTA